MKITQKNLEYNIEFTDENELLTFTNWCIDNKNIVSRFNTWCGFAPSHKTGTVIFNDEHDALAFKLRFI